MRARSATALVFALLLPGAVSLAQPMGGPMMGPGRMGGGMMGPSSPRRPYVMRYGLPEAYRTLSNPLRPSAENIATGKQLFQAQCAACHGTGGRGDGPAASQLNPPPSDLSLVVKTPLASDGYLYWTIAEGGTPVGSAMPPFQNTLTPDDTSKIILYLRSL